jgi:hypothetical protein
MATGENAYTYQLEGRSYISYQGLMYPIGVTPQGQRYVTKGGMMYPLPNTNGVMAGGLIFPPGTGGRAVLPAGQSSYQVGTTVPPPNAIGTDANLYYVDANHNVLAWDGTIAGPPGSSPANGAGSPDPANTVIGGGAALPPIGTAATPSNSTTPRSAVVTTSSVPSGLPSGTIRQSGASVSGPFIATLAVGVILIGGLAYYFTRKSQVEEGPRLRSVRTRSSRR